MARLADAAAAALLSQQGRLMPWAPVALALGIGLFFLQRSEPAFWLLIAAGVAGICGGIAALRLDPVRAPMVWTASLMALGFALAGARTHIVATPVLDYRYYGVIEGSVVGLDRSASGAMRITLSDVRLERINPNRVPRRVRISLQGAEETAPPPGARIMTTGHLAPPNGPTEPGGFDFQRHAWFLGIGAVGYTRNPVLLAEPASEGAGIFGLRMALSAYVMEAVDGPASGFAAAITTGDRSGLELQVTQALRDTNLAHLLAISGLHMGLLTGFVFGALRLSLALLPLGLWLPARKIAAASALAVGAVYLALSGGNVATERAFIMISVAFCAVLLDRRAISLRSVAVAALIVLVLRPEALLAPGFQMSFAATVALVAAFQVLTRWQSAVELHRARPVLALFVSASVAGLATLPFAAAHFNRMANYGLIANLIAPPVMGTVVVPAGVMAALLRPFGLDWMGFWVMEQGLNWIIWVAQTVAGWDAAVRTIPMPPGIVLPLISLGGLFVVLVAGRARWAGLLPMLAALGLWLSSERPSVLISGSGTLVGVMTEEGRALSKSRGAGFVARSWLENDGDASDQSGAAARWNGDGRPAIADLGDLRLIHASGKRALAGVEICQRGDILVASVEVAAPWTCEVLDPKRLRETGAIALIATEKGFERKTARQISGARLWNDRSVRSQFQ